MVMHGIYEGQRVLIEHTTQAFHMIRFSSNRVKVVKLCQVIIVVESVDVSGLDLNESIDDIKEAA